MSDKFIIVLACILAVFAFKSYESLKSTPYEVSSQTVAKNNIVDVVTTEPVTTVKLEIETETTVIVTEPVFKPYDFIPLSDELQTHIHTKCKEYGINYNLALAIIKTESNFNVDAVGDNGQATGLCQIWAKWHGQTAIERGLDINNPADNVELMLVIITSNLERCEGDMTGALQMYNTGSSSGCEYAKRVYSNLDHILTELGE